MSFTDYLSRIRLPNFSILAMNQKDYMTSQFLDMTSSTIFFDNVFFFFCLSSLVTKFQINIITGSEVMIIYFYERLTRNPEIENAPVRVLPNIWRLGQVRDTIFGTDVFNAKCQNYSFLSFLSY